MVAWWLSAVLVAFATRLGMLIRRAAPRSAALAALATALSGVVLVTFAASLGVLLGAAATSIP